MSVQFGRNENQEFHTFRHTDAAGLDREEVLQAIMRHFALVQAALGHGPYVAQLIVKGVSLEFRAYKFAEGDINVGRITIPSGPGATPYL